MARTHTTVSDLDTLRRAQKRTLSADRHGLVVKPTMRAGGEQGHNLGTLPGLDTHVAKIGPNPASGTWLVRIVRSENGRPKGAALRSIRCGSERDAMLAAAAALVEIREA